MRPDGRREDPLAQRNLERQDDRSPIRYRVALDKLDAARRRSRARSHLQDSRVRNSRALDVARYCAEYLRASAPAAGNSAEARFGGGWPAAGGTERKDVGPDESFHSDCGPGRQVRTERRLPRQSARSQSVPSCIPWSLFPSHRGHFLIVGDNRLPSSNCVNQTSRKDRWWSRALPADRAIAHPCPWFADHAPRRLVREAMGPDPSW